MPDKKEDLEFLLKYDTIYKEIIRREEKRRNNKKHGLTRIKDRASRHPGGENKRLNFLNFLN